MNLFIDTSISSITMTALENYSCHQILACVSYHHLLNFMQGKGILADFSSRCVYQYLNAYPGDKNSTRLLIITSEIRKDE